MEPVNTTDPVLVSPAPDRSWRRYAPTQLRQMVANQDTLKSLMSLFDQGLVSGTNFLTMVIIGRSCLAEELGVFHLLMTVILMSFLFQDALTSAPYRIYLRKKTQPEQETYSGSLFVHQLFVCGIVMAVLVGIYFASLSGILLPSIQSPLLPLFLLAPFILAREFLRRVSFAHLQFEIAILIDVLVTGFQLVALGTLAYLDLLTIPLAYTVIGCACLVSVIVWFVMNPVKRTYKRERFLKDWQENWSFARWSVGSLMVANMPGVLLLPWMLALKEGEQSIGILAACFTIIGVANVFLNGVENLLGPRSAHALHEGGKTELRNVIYRATVLMGVSMSIFTLALMFGGQWIALTLYGRDYAEFGDLMGWIIFALSLHVLAGAIGMSPGNGLWALERPNENFFASFMVMVVTFAVSIFLVYIVELGPLGIAIGTACGTTSGTIMRWVYFVRAYAEAPSSIESPVLAT
ncbi:hypothetical protein Pla110_30490 [Polystyrenella longa]|uniref:MurJ-like flippase n=1 Tax=Polystyrenella longa TaxID=2528007 RepID=A0A518CQ25_9PLAN|nr:hypothetical protein [Polystyrenella longa]QDU81308.1 hypothetical protein Pla110_30490 [Polystyrenella longa]